MDNVIKPIEPVEQSSKKRGGFLFLIIFFAVVFGVASGYGLVKAKGQSGVTGERVNTAKEVGIKDAKTFKDSAEGKLQKGGIDGEGTHHLIRPGGASQTVSLTSSVVDLDQFAGKNVKVYGQTFAAKNAGWLMDVGRVELK